MRRVRRRSLEATSVPIARNREPQAMIASLLVRYQRLKRFRRRIEDAAHDAIDNRRGRHSLPIPPAVSAGSCRRAVLAAWDIFEVGRSCREGLMCIKPRETSALPSASAHHRPFRQKGPFDPCPCKQAEILPRSARGVCHSICLKGIRVNEFHAEQRKGAQPSPTVPYGWDENSEAVPLKWLF